MRARFAGGATVYRRKSVTLPGELFVDWKEAVGAVLVELEACRHVVRGLENSPLSQLDEVDRALLDLVTVSRRLALTIARSFPD
jgi:hypothetical protein